MPKIIIILDGELEIVDLETGGTNGSILHVTLRNFEISLKRIADQVGPLDVEVIHPALFTVPEAHQAMIDRGMKRRARMAVKMALEAKSKADIEADFEAGQIEAYQLLLRNTERIGPDMAKKVRAEAIKKFGVLLTSTGCFRIIEGGALPPESDQDQDQGPEGGTP